MYVGANLNFGVTLAPGDFLGLHPILHRVVEQISNFRHGLRCGRGLGEHKRDISKDKRGDSGVPKENSKAMVKWGNPGVR